VPRMTCYVPRGIPRERSRLIFEMWKKWGRMLQFVVRATCLVAVRFRTGCSILRNTETKYIHDSHKYMITPTNGLMAIVDVVFIYKI
jgi:hypothetical protein